MAEQRTLKLPDGSVIYCYSDGSIERVSNAPQHSNARIRRNYGSNDGSGYLYVKVNKISYRVHRLIASAFVPNPLNLPEVDHINRNRNDNRPENLRWVSRAENCRNTQKGEDSGKLYGTRCFENKKAYTKAHGAIYRKKVHVLTMRNSNGKLTSRACSDDECRILKPIPLEERLETLNTLRKEISV